MAKAGIQTGSVLSGGPMLLAACGKFGGYRLNRNYRRTTSKGLSVNAGNN
jgi:hypothetical protein